MAEVGVAATAGPTRVAAEPAAATAAAEKNRQSVAVTVRCLALMWKKPIIGVNHCIGRKFALLIFFSFCFLFLVYLMMVHSLFALIIASKQRIHIL